MSRPLRHAWWLALLLGMAGSGQQPPPPDPAQTPRFRAGANLVRVDAYVSADGQLLTDLSRDDFEVLEDNVPQNVETFELVRPRPADATAVPREPNTVAESRAMVRDADGRLFVLFLDVWHVQTAGSYRAQGPLTALLDRVIGRDDMVGVMTPDMAARTVTFARRRESIDDLLKNQWFWGQRDRLNTTDPREQEIEQCYPDSGATAGLAREVIRRRREGRTLDALEDLIINLEGQREERKFVLLLSEGWLLSGPDASLSRAVGGVPQGPAVGTDPGGRLRLDPTQERGGSGGCERERSMLAYADHAHQFQQLLQRANRANVSFYPIDARGLVVFDEPLGPGRPLGIAADQGRLQSRQQALRTLAEVTDGFAIINTNNLEPALARIVTDTGAYYLLGYYSTNTRLDGRFRKLTVRVKRPGAEVRARPGYLAPTEAELASARVDRLMNGAAPGHTTMTPSVARAFDALAPARGTVPFRVQAAGARGRIWITGELDAATVKAAEWARGGRAEAVFEHASGDAPPVQVDAAIDAGQRSFQLAPPLETALAPGRYVVRLQLQAADGAVPFQTTAEVTVPGDDALLSAAGLVWRRGPATGLQYVPTADARFRRTERLRFEVARGDGEGDVSARLLGRDGLPLQVGIVIGERIDAGSGTRFVVADVTLAPLAQGEYAIEVAVARAEQKESATYAFRLVP